MGRKVRVVHTELQVMPLQAQNLLLLLLEHRITESKTHFESLHDSLPLPRGHTGQQGHMVVGDRTTSTQALIQYIRPAP